MPETVREAPTYSVSVWLAGDLDDAKRICRRFCMDLGLCVTVTSAAYIYTGGQEDGVCVRLVNYPRFPATPERIDELAFDLARTLRDGLCQWSVLVETPTRSVWLTKRESA